MLIVTCAIIEKDGKVLVAQRKATQKFGGKWEFPGGKLDPGESYETCIKRELREEMDVGIEILEQLPEAPIGTIGKLIPFRCKIRSGEIKLLDHQAMKWLLPTELAGVDFTEADIPVAKRYSAKWL
ncbi:MAG: (deoxy)nucleoside triphosphate pyrophosphohydrolase [Bacteroidia bacterium]